MKENKRQRRTHKELTDQLFSAISKMLSNQMFREIGINDLALEAKVEKNFIYKHYNELDGLLREYVLKNEYWGKTVLDSSTYETKSEKEIFNIVLQGLFKSFSENVDFQNIIRWEIASSNEYVKTNARRREKDGNELIDHFAKYQEKHPEKDILCACALMVAGVYYLILHKDISTFCGIDFTKKSECKRIPAVLAQITDFYFDENASSGKIYKIASRLLIKGMSIEEVASITELSINSVKQIKDSLHK